MDIIATIGSVFKVVGFLAKFRSIWDKVVDVFWFFKSFFIRRRSRVWSCNVDIDEFTDTLSQPSIGGSSKCGKLFFVIENHGQQDEKIFCILYPEIMEGMNIENEGIVEISYLCLSNDDDEIHKEFWVRSEDRLNPMGTSALIEILENANTKEFYIRLENINRTLGARPIFHFGTLGFNKAKEESIEIQEYYLSYSSDIKQTWEMIKKKVKEKMKDQNYLVVTMPEEEDRRPDGIEDIRISLYEDVYVVRRMPDGNYSIYHGEIDE